MKDGSEEQTHNTRLMAASEGGPRPGRWRVMRSRWLWAAIAGWLAANIWTVLAAPAQLPFDWPARAGRSTVDVLIDVNLALLQILLLMGVVTLLTRRRPDPRLAARSPGRRRALWETFGLLGYGALGMTGGFFLAKAAGWHPFGLHLAGTIFGTNDAPAPAEVLAWAGYNLVVYAVIPLIYFRRRYSPLALGLKSTAPRNDLLVIVVVLALELAFQIYALKPGSLGLPLHQLLPGAALTFALYLAGAVLPAMVFVYMILIPRYLRLTGSAIATVLLGGLTYAGLHFWDAWTLFSSAETTVLSVIFVIFTYLGPGMFKSFLTLRTGNAWVHVWAYHAFAPHTLIDTPNIVGAFRLK